MDQTLPASLPGGRYELVSEGERGVVEVIDREPWRCCWSCGSTENETGEFFCTNCGADLRDRRYQGIVTTTTNCGLPLALSLEDDAVRSLLPELWDRIGDEDRTLILLKPTDAIPSNLPLDELVALRVGLALSRMMIALHNHNLMVGTLAPNDLGLSISGLPKLLNVDDLCRVNPKEHAAAVRDDLQALAGLLESLTNTPRKTQRLDAEQDKTMTVAEGNSDLSTILSEIRTGIIEDARELAIRLEELIAERTNPIMLRQNVGSSTDTGMVRDHNEDSLLAMKLTLNNTSVERSWGIYIVADGMGGHAGGEVASGMAIRVVAEVLMNEYITTSLDPGFSYDSDWAQEVVRRAVLQANETVRREALSRSNDMGTTLTMAMVIGDRATVANVGDSRTYLYREGKLRRISKDHSLVMRLVDLGQITDDEIYTHPQRNAVLRSLGDRPNIEVDLFHERLRPGDAILLCSDGQWEMTHDPDMEHVLAANDDPQQTCEELIKAANLAGGEDNVTAILVRFQAQTPLPGKMSLSDHFGSIAG